MRRTMLLTVAALLIMPLLFLRPTQTQECETGLPKLGDYAPAGPTCKNKLKLEPWTGQPWIPNTTDPALYRCQLRVTVCGGVSKCYQSEGRPDGTGFCDDFAAIAKALMNREICCDEATSEPCENYSGVITCDCNNDGREETRKDLETCGIPTQWPRNFVSKCQDWVNPDGTIGYGTYAVLQRQGAEYLKSLDCEALKCYQRFRPCKQKADNQYEKCLTTANILGWRERCLRNANAAIKECELQRDKCLNNVRRSGPAATPQPLPTPTP